MRLTGALLTLIFLTGCTSHPAMPVVNSVDIDRFMGDWYVIAGITTRFERDAHNSIERYERGEDNRVLTTFEFNAGSFDGELKRFTPVGFIGDDPSNAIWGMQFIWPIKMDYRIVYLDDSYQHTIVGRNARDYVWIMARTPTIAESTLRELIDAAVALGYNRDEIVLKPQQPLALRDAATEDLSD